MKICLLVDDSKIVRKVVRGMVEPLGFMILEAEHGAQALEQLRGSAIQLMIIDGAMPVMDGISCIKAVRAEKNIAQPKIIFATADSAPEIIQHALAVGADAAMRKPFDAADLAQAIDKWCS